MLSFINKQTPKKRSPIKFMPALVYGHSSESPEQMTNKHSILYKSLSKKLPIIKPPSMLTEPPFANHDQKIIKQQKNREEKLISKHVPQNQIFNLTRGEFTTFLDNHKHYGSIGTLHKQIQKPVSLKNGNSSLTSIWNKSANPQSRSSYASSNKISLESSKKSSTLASIPSNSFQKSSSVSIMQRTIDKWEIRGRRSQFNQYAKNQIDERRKTKGNFFEMPRQGVDHQLFFIQKVKAAKQKNKGDVEELSEQLQVFENRLFTKFK